VAFPGKRDVDENYVRCMHALMSDGNYPGLATHDERIIAEAKRFAIGTRISGRSVRVPDAVRCTTRPAGTTRARRLSHARVRAIRHPMVSVPHAPSRGAAGESSRS
jgi:hypothetical protein